MAERQLTRRGTERRRQLMEYAAERFANGGFHPTSVAEGHVRDADPELLTLAVMGVLDRLSRALLRNGGLRADDLAEEAVAFCLGGLLRPDGD